MKKIWLIAGILVFIALIFSGCASKKKYDYSGAELKEISLSENDVVGMTAKSESLIPKNESSPIPYYGYIKTFSNENFVGGSNEKGYIEFFSAVYVLDSEENAKNFIKKETPGFRLLSVKAIGDESYVFSGQHNGKNLIMVRFRKRNIVSNNIFEGIDSNTAYNYARMLERKIV